MQKTYIIAEIGCNHNGSLELAYEMVDSAISCGVDAIKFQTFKSEKLVSKNAEMASYQKKNTGVEEAQIDMLKKLELKEEEFLELFKYIEEKGLEWFSTPFDDDSFSFLENLDMQVWKIPSGDVTNLPYLRRVGKLQKKVIISNGMATIEELEKAIDVMLNEGTTDITILHCITEYPAPDEEINLNTIPYLINKFPNLKVGLSDHSLGYEAPIASVAMGGIMVEKHFTTDNELPGPDQKASANPLVMKQMVEGIRRIEIMLGKPKLAPTTSELKNIPVARKSLVAAQNIKKGEILTEQNVTIKRPGSGISPMLWDEVIGSPATKDYEMDELI